MMVDDNEEDSVFDIEITEEDVETQFGAVHCTLRGVPKASRPVIITYHDIGLNHNTCFSPLFTHEDMQEIVRHFAVCHVDAPGQHEGATTLPAEHTYPTIDQLSEMLPHILKHFGLKSVICLGMGAGAYILAQFALNYPDMVEGLVLININASSEGMMDSVAHKITGWAHTHPNTIISHLFGKEEIQHNHDLIATYRHHITCDVNQANLQHFIKSYYHRHDLDIERPEPGGHITPRTLKCQSLLVVGDSSPAVDAVVKCNYKLNPTKTTLLKMADCGGMPQVDQPAKLTEAFKYFIQGLGHMPSVSMTRLVRSRTASGSSIASFDGSRQRSVTNERRGHAHGPDDHARSHTSVAMDTSGSGTDQTVIKTSEVAC